VSERKPPACIAILGAVFALAGVGILLWALSQRGQAQASESWPTASAEILSSELTESSSSDSTSYHAAIEYAFEVDGVRYTGSQVSFGDPLASQHARASSLVETYSAGRTVPVAYDPDDPSRCVLEPGEPPGAWILLAVGPFFVVIGLLIGFVVPRHLAQSRAAS